jgi:hypothetical protein
MQDSRPLPPATSPISRRNLLKALLAAPALAAVPALPALAAPRVAAPAIVPFTDWAPSGCPLPAGGDPAPTRRLVVHHTYEPVAATVEDVLPALATTCDAHVERGFSTIGYHYVVDPWGTVYQGRGLLPGPNGRAPAAQPEGAHVAGSNAGAVGVVFVGDHESAPPTPAALTAATQLLAWLLQDLGVDPSDRVPTISSGVGTARFVGEFHPRVIAGHSASNSTACPGEHLVARLTDIRNRVRELNAGMPMTPWPGAPEPTRDEQTPGSAVDARAAGSRPAAPTRGVPPSRAAGPRMSPTEVSADRLRAVGLDSLAAQLAPGLLGG